MNRRTYIAAILFVLIGTSSYAQSVAGIFRVSKESSGYSTARSSAMGGILDSNKGDLQELHYRQNLTTEGQEFSFKFGATLQPVNGLKIGVTIHAPKVYSLFEAYNANINCYYVGNEHFWDNSSSDSNFYRVQSPTRFLVGISYTIGNSAIISADYESVWYNKIKVKNIEYAPREVTLDQEIQAKYTTSSNFKFGVEFNVSNGFFLGGYAYYGKSS